MLRAIISFFIFSLMLTPSLAAEKLTAQQIAQNVHDRYIGDDMQMKGLMELISESGHIRSRQFTSIRKDGENTRRQLIRFTAPADIKGTGFLTIETEDKDTEQHLYLPALKRTRRIVTSQKGRSFVNSDFTYEDMNRQTLEEWDYSLDREAEISGRTCYILTSTPKPGTKTQYGKTTSWVDKEYMMALKTLYWDAKGKHTKTFTVNAFEVIDNIATEVDITMINMASSHKTRLKTEAITYNSGLSDSLFTKRALEK